MDTDLRCNRLACRRALTDKAVVTTCSHIFCVDCANELFNASRLCPACEASLLEPDDVVVCSLHPSNDYKTSVLSGLSPSTILEICGRAISFWQYQVHQENSFQQAVVRNVNDKNTQLQKQLENVVREANSEINILGNKVTELERDLELERRKIRELQEGSRERDKEYQKLKNQLDKVKRKALLAPDGAAHNGFNTNNEQSAPKANRAFGGNFNGGNLAAVVGGMEAHGIQRTPVVNRSGTGFNIQPHSAAWQPVLGSIATGGQVHQSRIANPPQRQAFDVQRGDGRSARSVSERSDTSINEVENMLMSNCRPSTSNNQGWGSGGAGGNKSGGRSSGNSIQRSRPNQPSSIRASGFGVAPAQKRTSSVFRPAGAPR